MTRTLLAILSISLPIIVLTGCSASSNVAAKEGTPKVAAKEGTTKVTQQEAQKQKALDRRSLVPFTILEGTPYKVGVVVESKGNDSGSWDGSFFSSKGDSKVYSNRASASKNGSASKNRSEVSKDGSDGSSKGGSDGLGKEFNYIFLNTQTREIVKLLPKSDSLFTSLEKIGKQNNMGEFTKVDAIWYQVIKDGAKKSEDRPKITIATSTTSGKNYTELIPQVDRILNTFQSGATKIQILYELNKKYFIAELDLAERKVIENKELPSLE